MKSQIYSVIMAGGKGTRFWPLSRSQRPKQLLKLLSPKSLIGETASRTIPISGRRRTLVVTVVEQLNAMRKELPTLARENFLAEPQGKNTAPCIGLAAIEVAARDADAVMIILPADHWVADVPAFQRTLTAAVELALRHNDLVTIGIKPDYPETGYGYIVKDKFVETRRSIRAYRVKNFTEKPKPAKAQQLIRKGSLWNSGIFVWKASTLLELLSRYQPDISRGLEVIRNAANGKSLATANRRLRAVIVGEYKKMPDISIDYAVLEKAGPEGRVQTLQADFGWNDVGSWAAVHRMSHRDANGNAGNGEWISLSAKNCLIHAPERLVVLLGLENTVVVDTPDALLVGDLSRSQEVKELVEELKKKGYGSYTIK